MLVAPGRFTGGASQVVAAGDRFFERHGPKAVFIARWIAFVRFAAAWLAGINGMRFRTFFVWNALGGITWGITYGLVGYFVGSAAADVITRFGVYAAGALLVLIVVGYGYLKLRERRHFEQERDALGRASCSAQSGSALVGFEVQRAGVDAVAQAGRVRAVVEHVTEMAAAALAHDLGAAHAEAAVLAQPRCSRPRRARRSSASRCPTRTSCPS